MYFSWTQLIKTTYSGFLCCTSTQLCEQNCRKRLFLQDNLTDKTHCCNSRLMDMKDWSISFWRKVKKKMSCHILPPWQLYQAHPQTSPMRSSFRRSPGQICFFIIVAKIISITSRLSDPTCKIIWEKQQRQRGWQRGVCFYLWTTKEMKRGDSRPL